MNFLHSSLVLWSRCLHISQFYSTKLGIVNWSPLLIGYYHHLVAYKPNIMLDIVRLDVCIPDLRQINSNLELSRNNLFQSLHCDFSINFHGNNLITYECHTLISVGYLFICLYHYNLFPMTYDIP